MSFILISGDIIFGVLVITPSRHIQIIPTILTLALIVNHLLPNIIGMIAALRNHQIQFFSVSFMIFISNRGQTSLLFQYTRVPKCNSKIERAKKR